MPALEDASKLEDDDDDDCNADDPENGVFHVLFWVLAQRLDTGSRAKSRATSVRPDTCGTWQGRRSSLPPHASHLQRPPPPPAAEGYLELGMPIEADRELELIFNRASDSRAVRIRWSGR